jgi:chromate transporter
MDQSDHDSRLGSLGVLLLFSKLSLIGFGGVLPWARRTLVEQRKIVSPDEFAQVLAFAQLLPGPTICNMAIIIGFRRHGLAGAGAALCGLVVPPAMVVLGLGYLHGRLGDTPLIQAAMRGMSVVAAALIARMAIQMVRALPLAPVPVLFALAMFGGVGLMHWPLLAVMAGLSAPSLALQWRSGAA